MIDKITPDNVKLTQIAYVNLEYKTATCVLMSNRILYALFVMVQTSFFSFFFFGFNPLVRTSKGSF